MLYTSAERIIVVLCDENEIRIIIICSTGMGRVAERHDDVHLYARWAR